MKIQACTLLASGVLLVASVTGTDPPPHPGGLCPQNLQAVYADMHDGDKKEVTISGTSMTIKPSGNTQTWVVNTTLDSKSCSASVDFNVPGKPSPPPVKLNATFWYSIDSNKERITEFEFTDPSGTLPAGPLNRWVQLSKDTSERTPPCMTSLKAIYADMHDGDKKEVTINQTLITIKPSGNNQTWVVNSQLDHNCSAVIDFNVPGKPNPPPVNLKATLWITFPAFNAHQRSTEFEFTDPSATLAAADFPLNHWVEISKESADRTQNTKTGFMRNADRALPLKALKESVKALKEYAGRAQNTKTGVERKADRAVSMKAMKESRRGDVIV